MEHLVGFVQAHGIVISAVILVLAYVFIALEKIPKVTIALFGAAITLFIGLLSQAKVVNDAINPLYFINFVDFNVIFLLISMMIIVEIASKSGVFALVANRMLMVTKGEPVAILWTLMLFTAVASAFLDNVTTVILIMPITFAIAKKLDINPIPYLISEIFSSNIGGTATLIGDPPNIIIGSAANFGFMDFILELTPIVVVIMLVVGLMLTVIFRKELVSTPEKMAEAVNIDNFNVITNKALALRALIVLGLVILGFVLHDLLELQPYVIAMLGATFLLLFEKPTEIFKTLEWNTIFFFVGLFIIIGGFEAAGGISLLAHLLLDITHGSQVATTMIIVWASGILSGIIDNIPYTATMAPLIAEIQHVMGTQYAYPLWWALSLGACLGGNFTIIGAAANVIVSETSAAAGYPIKFMSFLKYGALITLTSLTLSTAYIVFRFL